ncbi:MAG TPA: pyridoxamine 5'-phosphate oxidase family protein [Kofleriaceae bacterium]|jgi:nitroimidazol reductase NimA-like FMN-containing flavoprotein (pyridoxamine 5'-phosphate oxidase superfamily)|nr:pyridoxamine 5'-phosphate oxidase family protein [Kofleriaceae bacterium]
MSAVPVTDRTRVRRKPMRGTHERAAIDAILDEALICHVGFVADHGPIVIPTTHVRVADQLYIHGSAASHMLGSLAGGIDACVTVTLLDGLVLARTAFHHSVNYRSVVLFGRAVRVDDTQAKLAALDALVDRVAPGRSAACRPPSAKELTATTVLAVPIAEASAKIRSGPPLPDDGEDLALPYWAGVIPLHTSRGAPINAPDCTLAWPGDG